MPKETSVAQIHKVELKTNTATKMRRKRKAVPVYLKIKVTAGEERFIQFLKDPILPYIKRLSYILHSD